MGMRVIVRKQNMWRNGLWVGLTLLAFGWGGISARADYARGQFNNWQADCPLTQAGNYYTATMQAANVSGAAGLKFDLDGNWGSTQWGAGTAATVNSTIGTANNSAGSGNLSMSVTSGKWYTFHLAGTYAWENRSYLVMETSAQPVEIASVSDDSSTAGTGSVTVTATLSASKSTEEDVYIMYTADSWSTKSFTKMSVNGVTATGTIPGQVAGTGVAYFIFSSTMPTNLFTSSTIYSDPANLDQVGFCMLAVNNHSGANYSYTVTAPAAEPAVYLASGLTSCQVGSVFSLTFAATNFANQVTWSYTLVPTQAMTVVAAGILTVQAQTSGVYQLTATAANSTESASSEVTLTVTEPNYANVWHEPEESPTGWSTPMRNPLSATAGEDVRVYLGNYTPDGALTGGTVYYKEKSNPYWNLAALTLNSTSGNNQFWEGVIPGSALVAGSNMVYYLYADAVESSGRADVYLGTVNQTNGVKYATAGLAVNYLYEFAVAAAPEKPFGNVWHFPTNCEPWASAGMRAPVTPVAGATTWVRMGASEWVSESFTNADMTGGALIYRIGNGAWTEVPLGFETTTNNNKYWSNSIPAQSEGTAISYVLRADYANQPSLLKTTYLGTSDQADNVKYETLAEAQAHAWASTSVVVRNLGNAWHVPTNAEPSGTYMRNPRHPYANQAVSLYNGNQDSGAEGTPGNQTNGVVWYRLAGGTWQSTEMSYDSSSFQNKYWRGEIAANTFSKTQTVQYVFQIGYSDRDTTYLGLAPNSSVASGTYGTLAEAQARPFDFTYGGDAGTEPGFVWHAGNAVKVSSTNVQLWVKVGYKSATDQWADEVEVRYAVTTAAAPASKAQGARRVAKSAARAADPSLTKTVAMRLDHTEYDGGGNGDAMWWVADVTDADLAASANAVLRYQIAARKTTGAGGNGVWRLAEYQADGVNDQVFEYRMIGEGATALTVNGLNADYTTSKFFIDEAAGETAHLRVLYVPPSGATDVQLFSNVGRRDFWNADIDANGVADAIRPPSGDIYTTGTTNGYYRAYPMRWSASDGAYVWESDIGQCGAYRLTARYKASGASTWTYYSETGSGIRDHAVVISPKKVLRQTVYELNALSAKATSAAESGRSTFASLIDGADSFDTFGIQYLNKIQANCLWFQPIHTSSEYGLAEGGEPGSPYAAKDYFSVSKWFGREATAASALSEFQQFVAACDAGKTANMANSSIGTINIMLDGVFNHTSWDAILGQGGVDLGYGSATNAIASLHPGWYANVSDYGAPATWYNGPAGGQHDIACAPDRGDFGKWTDTAELFFGNYAALTRHNPEDNGAHLNEEDWYDYSSMTAETEKLWNYMGYYVEYWLQKTGHPGSNTYGEVNAAGVVMDDLGIDGLRCDFGQGLPPQFWEYCINRARAHKWNFMFMAESLDGGNVSYRSNRHFDILNESFVFSMVSASSPSDVKNALESRRSMYNGGAILLNLTSHDEVMPYSDPWTTASRYAMVSSVMGLPMCFFGQEQGIVPCTASKDGHSAGDKVAGDNASGFAWFELNMGKWVPHFKEWNRLTIWNDPPSSSWSREMAQWYGRVNWARLNSPALQSGNQYFLGRKGEGTYDNGRILAVAKAVDDATERSGKDAVLAFTLFVNVGDHSAISETYDLAACANFIGLENSTNAFYNVRNLASSDASAYLWTTPQTGADLVSNGLWVNLTSDTSTAIYDDGAIVQYLKLEKVDASSGNTTNSPAPVPYAWIETYYPGTSDYEAVAVSDTDGDGSYAWAEYLADTDPTDSASVFSMVSSAIEEAAAVGITVAVRPNRVYEIEFSDVDLSAPLWTAFADAGVWTNADSAATHTFTDDGTSATSGHVIPGLRTYRVNVRLP